MTREQAAQLVAAAWLNEGPHPPTHRKAQEQLKRDWPTLYEAVVALVNAEG